jgi:predicted aspartyl protease
MNGREVEALIDTGACRSVLSRTFSNFIQAEIRPLKPTDLPILVSADGYSLRVVGTTTVDVTQE